jgi:6-phosphofructokinase 1
MVVKDVGYELRCVAPNAFDQEYTRELGAGAVDTLLGGQADVMITRQNQRIVPIPFSEILDPQTGKTRVRMLDVGTESFRTALGLQTRLGPKDFDDDTMADRLEQVGRLDIGTLRARFTD